MYKLLYNSNKKKLRKELKPCVLSKSHYEDTERIREQMGIIAEDETLRVRLIRTDPVPSYRVSILKKYKHPHTIKNREGRSVLLQPGLYVSRQHWVESQKDGLVFIPPLKDNNNGNVEKN